MKSLTLKNKLVVGSLTMVILVMAASAAVVSVVINRQNRDASYQNIEKSLNIMKSELSVIQNKLLSDVRQMANINAMGSSIKFILDFKGNEVMTRTPLKKMANDICQIGQTKN